MHDLSKIKAVITDVDGVMTDGKIIVHEDGSESKEFNVKDGQMIVWCKKHLGLKFGAISGRPCKPVEKRLRDLNFDYIATGSKDKKSDFDKCLDSWKLKPEEVLYAGDDFPDVPLFFKAGISACPADAGIFVHKFADFETNATGGKGVIAELLLQIAEARLGSDKIMELIKNQ